MGNARARPEVATARLAAEQPSRTLQVPALVHEAYVRLVDITVWQTTVRR
jgi:hypothetical protein